MVTSLLLRLGATAVLFITLPAAIERLATYFQFSPIFEGVVAIATCFGACLPVLSMLKNAD